MADPKPAKLDYKKEYKDLYMPGKKPTLVEVPPILFLMVDGQGAPESPAYQNAVGALYALTFTIKFSKMSGQAPEGYFEYVVPPLEGLWWSYGPDGAEVKGYDPQRAAWHWTSMIRQPDFVTPEVLAWARQEAARKKPELDLSGVRLATFHEGLCVQAMHLGPYSTEPETVAQMDAYVAAHGLAHGFGSTDENGLPRRHHEIYLGDPRKTAPERRKTVLRHPVFPQE